MSATSRSWGQWPGRPLAFAQKAMAATSSPAATLAALDVMKNGGNAVDAAVTASAVLCITEPHMTGIGGDCFAIIAWPGGKRLGLNGAGRSAQAATAEWLRKSALRTIDSRSIHAVTAPGAIDAWDTLLKAHGSISLAEALQPAIALAEQGIPTQPRVARDWAAKVGVLAGDPGASKHYLLSGRAPLAGEVMRYPSLAATLRRIANDGRDAFYEGEIAADMLATLQAKGSLLTGQDFAATRADWVTPISTDFHGTDIWEIPPSGQGLTVLIALNILRHFELARFEPDSPQRKHLEIEALKRAWALRNRHIADPDFSEIPVVELLSEQFGARLAESISPDRAQDIVVNLPQSDTVYLAVVDQNRLCCSFINSIYWWFGSGITSEKTGITFQNRGAGFSCDPAHPNVIAPSKRPLHTIIPSLATKEGRNDMVFGVMSGDFQPMGHVNMVLNSYVYGLDPQAALDLPRLGPSDGVVECEFGVSETVKRDLARRGHRIVETEELLGGGQIIRIDEKTGLLSGGSDPRKDGFAAGF
jgi:gamma-glutamyltranspeptidase / glutathione hydrolase